MIAAPARASSRWQLDACGRPREAKNPQMAERVDTYFWFVAKAAMTRGVPQRAHRRSTGELRLRQSGSERLLPRLSCSWPISSRVPAVGALQPRSVLESAHFDTVGAGSSMPVRPQMQGWPSRLSNWSSVFLLHA
jgi:hypothetical protein